MSTFSTQGLSSFGAQTSEEFAIVQEATSAYEAAQAGIFSSLAGSVSPWATFVQVSYSFSAGGAAHGEFTLAEPRWQWQVDAALNPLAAAAQAQADGVMSQIDGAMQAAILKSREEKAKRDQEKLSREADEGLADTLSSGDVLRQGDTLATGDVLAGGAVF